MDARIRDIAESSPARRWVLQPDMGTQSSNDDPHLYHRNQCGDSHPSRSPVLCPAGPAGQLNVVCPIFFGVFGVHREIASGGRPIFHPGWRRYRTIPSSYLTANRRYVSAEDEERARAMERAAAQTWGA